MQTNNAERLRVHIADTLPREPFKYLTQMGMQVTFTDDSPKISNKLLGAAHIIVVRSRTRFDTPESFVDIPNAQLIVRAGVGVDSILIPAATERGIAVANTPDANTESAAEHTIALMFAVARKIVAANQSLQNGEWTPTKFVGVELQGKTLGIIGMGKIGSRIAQIAKYGIGMEVIAYDPAINEETATSRGAELVSLDKLLERSHVITVHVPLIDSTRNLINEEAIGKTRQNPIILNVARGGVVDEMAVVKGIRNGKIYGAGFDVYVDEPHPLAELIETKGVVSTPHLGASTNEAQGRVAIDAAQTIIDFSEGKPLAGGVNLPRISPETMRELSPFAEVTQKIAALALAIAPSKRVSTVDLVYRGKIAGYDTRLLRAAAIEGLIKSVSDRLVNLVNADSVARERGLRVLEHLDPSTNTYTSSVEVKLSHGGGETTVSGIHAYDGVRVVAVDGYNIEIPLKGPFLLLCEHVNKPGMIGKIGTVLGNEGVNITKMSSSEGSGEDSETALMGLLVDKKLDATHLTLLQQDPAITSIHIVQL